MIEIPKIHEDPRVKEIDEKFRKWAGHAPYGVIEMENDNHIVYYDHHYVTGIIKKYLQIEDKMRNYLLSIKEELNGR